MEEKKNNKGLVWLIVILIILVLGLVVYVVYDKVILDDKTISNNDETTTTNTTTKIETLNEKMKNENLLYNKVNNDNTLIYKEEIDNLRIKAKVNNNEKYSNIIYNEDNYKFQFNCLETDLFGSDDQTECVKHEIIINDKIKSNNTYSPSKEYLYITEKYTIIQTHEQQPMLEEIRIYDNANGNLVLSISNSIMDGLEDGLVKINNNILYYISSDADSMESTKEVYTSKVDLSVETLKIDKIKN